MIATYIKGSFIMLLACVGMLSRGAAQCTYKVERTEICYEVNGDSAKCRSKSDVYVAGIDAPLAVMAISEMTGSIVFKFIWYRPDGTLATQWQTDTLKGGCSFYWFVNTPGAISNLPINIGTWQVDFQVSYNGEPFKSVGKEPFVVVEPSDCNHIVVEETFVCAKQNLVDTSAVCKKNTDVFVAGVEMPTGVFRYHGLTGNCILEYQWYRPDGKLYSRQTDTWKGECTYGWYYFTIGTVPNLPENIGEWKLEIQYRVNGSPLRIAGTHLFKVVDRGSDVITLDLGEVEASPNEEVLIPLYTKNFKDVFGVQFSLKLASTNLEIIELVPTPVISTFNSRKVDDQTYGVIWVSETAEAITVQDSSVLLWVKVRLKESAENAGCILVNIHDNPIDLIAFQSINGVPSEVRPEVFGGEVCILVRKLGEIKGTITYHGAKPFGNATVILSTQSISNANNPVGLGLQIGTTSGELGQEVVVPISVINYKGVSGFQGTFKIDSRDVQITKLSSANVNFVITSNIINPQVVSFVGYSDQPLTLTDGTPLLSLSLKVTNNANPNNCVLIEASNAPVELLATQTIAGGEQSVNPVIFAGILGIGAVDCAGTPGLQQHTLSDAQGAYGFKNLLQGEVYTITPVFSKQHRNGVNVADLIVLRQHVLAQKTLGEKSLFIAGDVDNNKALGLMDLVQIQRLILGEIDSFSGVHSWRFVANTYLQDAGRAWTNLPYDFQAELNAAEIKVDFTGIKLGDLTRSAQLRSGETLPLSTPDKRFTAGQLLQSVFSMNAQHLEGFQLEFDYNAQILSFEGLSQFSDVYKLIYFTPKPGKLSILVYLQPQARAGMTDAELQFNLLFKALKEGTLAENLRINTDRISAIALSAGYEMPLSLHFSGKEEDFGFQNWSHQVIPNPVSHAANLSIWAPTAQVLDLKIMDINGRIVETITLSCQGGENFIPLNMQRLSSNGLYYYSLQSKDLLLSGKFVVQER